MTTTADYRNDISADLASTAFMGTSMRPERAGEIWRDDYASTLDSDLQKIRKLVKDDEAYASEAARYRQNLADKYRAFLSSHSNCISSFIAGPANFSVRRAEKRNRWADNKLNEIRDFRARALRAIRRKHAKFDGHAILGDDPDAISKLRGKLASLEGQRELMKAANKAYKMAVKRGCNGLPDDELLVADVDAIHEKVGYGSRDFITQAIQWKPAYSFERGPYVGWPLSNLGANIRRVQQRIAEMEHKEAHRDEAETVTIGDVQIVENVEANRVQVIFPGKPAADVRSDLKRAGFRWAPSAGAWQRHLSADATARAVSIVKQHA